VTHVWFETNPRVHLLNPERPLLMRLGLDDTYDTWIPVAEVPDIPDVEEPVRVRLSNGKAVKGPRQVGVPKRGAVAGWALIDPTRSPPVTGTPGGEGFDDAASQ
jgi:hypothetical protein